MPFINDNFLLQSKTARYLYRKYAEDQPIVDYHCHIPAAIIAENRQFSNLFELWLAGDHYKWRAMRANGVAERFITGDAGAVRQIPGLGGGRFRASLRNPLYHWTHLELKRYFGIDELLNERTAPRDLEARQRAVVESSAVSPGHSEKI